MASVTTPWGYTATVEDPATTLPAILSVTDFATLTGGAFSSPTDRVEAVITAATHAVRVFCGWHVSPSLACEWVGDGDAGQVALPAMAVSAVSSVTVAGLVLDPSAYEWRRSGLVRFPLLRLPDEWRSVDVCFTAGIGTVEDLANVVCQIVANDLAAAPGLAAERAGEVQATYNKTADGVSGGISLLDRDRELLAPYRLPWL